MSEVALKLCKRTEKKLSTYELSAEHVVLLRITFDLIGTKGITTLETLKRYRPHHLSFVRRTLKRSTYLVLPSLNALDVFSSSVPVF